MNVTVMTAPSGSGSSKGAGSEARNTLRSKSVARVLCALGEGELRLHDGEKSIFFDGVPLMADDGTRNFQGVSWSMNRGLADQSALPGFSAIETEVVYGAEVKKHIPVTRSITNPDATSARVTIRIPALAFQPAKGGLKGSSVVFRIEVRPDGGAWTNPFGDVTISGKCTAPYDRSFRLVLPRNSGGVPSYPWDIRVTRITNDSDDVDDDGIPDDTEASIKTRTENRTVLQAVTEIVERRLSYPYTAHWGGAFDAKKFGPALPTLSFEVDKVDGRVPVNYDPVTRTYTGVWNGQFKTAETSNPAWAVYDMLASKRFGLGRELSAEALDMVKWDLYEIAQYCDQTIPDGFGGTEPRFTFNGVIKSQKEAYDLIAMLMSVVRGMTYWSSGAIRAVADQPTDPIVLATPANVIDGDFRYSGTALKSRHTVVHVTWNDPEDRYRPAVEVVEDAAGIRRFGRRVKAIVAVGCTSRGQARRFGLWILATELGEDQIVTYRAGFDHAYVTTGHPGVVPGDVVAIQDPRVAGVDWSGRLLAGTTASVVKLDRSVTLPSGTNTLSVVLPSGATASRTVSTTGTASTLTLASALPETPAAGAVWILQSSSLSARHFRVTSVAEVEKHVFEIKGLVVDTTKYARVDYGVTLKKRIITKLTTRLGKPVNLTSREYQFLEDGAAHSKLTFSWSAPSVGTAVAYHAVVETPAGEIDFGVVTATSIDITDAVAGDYVLNVASVGYNGKESDFATLPVTATGWTGSTVPTVTDLKLVGGDTSTTFSGRNVTIAWVNTLSSGGSAGNPFYLDDVIEVRDASDGTLIRTQSVRGETWTYAYDLNTADCLAAGKSGPARQLAFSVVCRDTLGRESDPATLTVSNPVPAAITPTLVGTNEMIWASWPTPADKDFAGVLMWIGTTETFTPGPSDLAYDGPDSGAIIPKAVGTYWVVIAAYDAFGKTGLNLSSPTSVTVSKVVDTTQPPVPTGLALTPSLVRAADGTVSGRLQASVTAITADVFAYYEFAIKEGSGSWIAFNGSSEVRDWVGLLVSTTYSVRVRALSKSGYPSAWCDTVSATIPANTTPPAAPTGLAATAAYRNVFLDWINPSDSDLAEVEVWASTTNNRVFADLVGKVRGSRFTHDLGTGSTRWYWVRAVNTSGVAGDWNAGATSGVSATTLSVPGADISAASVTAEKLAAGSVTTDKLDANAVTSEKIAADAITAALVTISGSTKLSSWLNGTDETKIDGGIIAANTIAANALKIGARGLVVDGIDFQYTVATATLSWTAGTIAYVDDDGSKVARSIASGSLVTTVSRYVYWVKGATAFSTTTSYTSAIGAENVVMAIFSASTGLAVLFGGTVIDGSRIVGLSIQAAQIAANAIVAEKIAAGAVTTEALAANAVTAAKIAAGTITGAHIVAGTIDATKLTVGDLANMIPDNHLQTIEVWALSGANPPYFSTATAAQGGKMIRIGGTVAGSGTELGRITTSLIPVKPGANYNIGFKNYGASLDEAANPGGTVCRVYWYKHDFTASATTYTSVWSKTLTSGTTVDVNLIVTAPADAVYARVAFVRYSDIAAVTRAGTVNFYNLFLRPTVGTVQIEDGAITADKLTVASLSAISANLGTVTAGIVQSTDAKFKIDLANKRILISD